MLKASSFRNAIIQAFAFLTEYGFALAPPMASSSSTETVEYVRSDALLRVRYFHGTFSISLMPSEDDDASFPADARLRRRKARDEATSRFGSYPLRLDDPDKAASVIASYAERFIAPIADLLNESPPDFLHIAEVLQAVKKRLSDKEWLAIMHREAKLAWTEQRWCYLVKDYESNRRVTDLTDEESRRLEYARTLVLVRPPSSPEAARASTNGYCVALTSSTRRTRLCMRLFVDVLRDGRGGSSVLPMKMLSMRMGTHWQRCTPRNFGKQWTK